MADGLITERFPVRATVDPAALTDGATSATDNVDMEETGEVAFTLLTGSAATTEATCTIALQVSTDGTTFTTADVTAFALTADTAEQAVVTIRADQMPSGKRYVRALLTASADDTTGINVAAVANSSDHVYEPADDKALATVTEYPTL